MRRLDRRSFLLQVVGTSMMAGGLRAEPSPPRQMAVDSDPSDPARAIPAPAPAPAPTPVRPPPPPPNPVPSSGAAAPAAATFIVVRVSGPSASLYPLGTRLPANARIALRAGDSLVVLGAAGTRTLRGPGNFSPGPGLLGAVSGSVSGPARSLNGPVSGARRSRSGAVRGPTERFVVCPGHPRCPR